MTMWRGRVRSSELLITLLTVTVSLLCQIGTSSTAAALDIAQILDAYPEFSLLNQLLNITQVADEINNSKGGLTLFAPSNSKLSNFQASVPSSFMADVLRHHVVTEYLELRDLQGLTTVVSMPTLLQTTADSDVVVISNNELGTVLNNTLDTSVVGSITQVEKEISILRINNVLRPARFPSLPPAPKGSDSQDPFNISRTLATLEDFDVFSQYLQETGVDSLLEGRQGTEAGCTIFVPTDAAFNALPGNWFQKLSKNDQRLLLEYHSLDKFFSLGDLWQLGDFPSETVASTLTHPAGASFILRINSTNGVVNVRASKSNATITSTLYQSDPVIMFAIDTVLLPREVFGDNFAFAPSSDSPVESPASNSPSLSPAASSPSKAPNKPTPRAPPPVIAAGGRAAGRPASAFMLAVTIMASLLVSSRLLGL